VTRTAPHAQTGSGSAQDPARRTVQIERRQTTRRQCACQRLHARISDVVVCRPRASGPPLRHHAPLCALARFEAIRLPPPGRKLGNTQLARQRTPRPEAVAHKPQPHAPPRLSVVRLGGSARASASTPASPMWLSAGRKQPTLQYDATHHCAHSPAPRRFSCRPSVESSASRTRGDSQRSARPDRERQHTSPRPYIPLR
jgi:hypothetical protein